MDQKKSRLILIATGAVCLVIFCIGTGFLWNYENTPGLAATAPEQWPGDSCIVRASDRPTLVMLAHPHCPCTRASIGELSRLMTQAQGRVTAYVLFVKPSEVSDGWEQTDLMKSAAAIPGVTAVRDEDGLEASRFHAATSGQVVLYAPDGKLLFSGGITSARGHAGDNAGRSAIVSLLTRDEATQGKTPVFGCPLFAHNNECPITKEAGGADSQQ